jgi:hypothetical protein
MFGYKNQYVVNESGPIRKSNKPGFFKRWLLGQVKDAYDQSSEPSLLISKSESASIDQPERAINFTVYSASGGRVVETRRYDRKSDRYTNGLYIITGDQEFGREIDKIITMESLK